MNDVVVTALEAPWDGALEEAIERAERERCAPCSRVNVDGAQVRKGLGQLVLTLVKVLHEVMEKQAIRRMESGTLSDEEVEKVGSTLMLQAREIGRLCREFGLEESDLNVDLGPLGRLL